MPSNEALVEQFCREADRILPTVFTPDCCLNGTRVVIEGLSRLGIRAEPASVHFLTCNRAYVEKSDELQRLPTVEEMQADSRDPWAIGVDTNSTNPRGWPGHLVAVVAGQWLVDAAAGQFNRPRRSIYVPNVVMTTCTQKFLKGREQVTVRLHEEGRIFYGLRKKDRSYEKVAGFQRSPHNIEVANMILKAMEIGR